MTIERKLLGTNPVATGGASPEAVSFDGTNDYLSRSSDLVGNADGKTFTLSAWVYSVSVRQPMYYNSATSSENVGIEISNGGKFSFITDLATVTSYNINTNSLDPIVESNTWNHIVFSFDGDTQSNCKLYVNNEPVALAFDTFVAGTNIAWTDPVHGVGVISWATSVKSKGRLAHLFLDYTYRDLSITANRRLFIDADGKPADGQADLSPILYLPMTSADTAGSNSGTGGDFTVNGVLSTAERGPNQDNCSASVFDGAADYLSSPSTTTAGTDSKVFTSAFHANQTNTSGNPYPFFSPAEKVSIQFTATTGKIAIRGKNAGGTEILNIETDTGIFTNNENLFVSLSIDMASQLNTKIFINGVSQTITFSSFTNDTLVFSNSGAWEIGRNATTYFTGVLGEFYFNEVYTDLATDNPFWDSTANRPNSVRKVIADTGVTPLIALPIIGSDAGNNLGSGGDFTVNSGPYTGARGGSEYWARSWTRADGVTEPNANIGYLHRTGSGLIGAGNSTVGSLACSFKFNTLPSTIKQNLLVMTDNANSSEIFKLDYKLSINRLAIRTYTQANSRPGIEFYGNSLTLTTGKWYTLLACWNTATPSSCHMYLNTGTSLVSIGTVNYSSGDATLYASADDIAIGALRYDASYPSALEDGDMSHTYLSTSYRDHSQEANRQTFIGQLGYPKDLTQQIEDGDIASPLIYMKSDDTTALGTNSGTGGDFTINGTVAAGPDFTK